MGRSPSYQYRLLEVVVISSRFFVDFMNALKVGGNDIAGGINKHSWLENGPGLKMYFL